MKAKVDKTADTKSSLANLEKEAEGKRKPVMAS
jgi:hypothetical protein